MEFLLTKMKMSLIVYIIHFVDFMKNIILIYFECRLNNVVGFTHRIAVNYVYMLTNNLETRLQLNSVSNCL